MAGKFIIRVIKDGKAQGYLGKYEEGRRADFTSLKKDALRIASEDEAQGIIDDLAKLAPVFGYMYDCV